MDEERHDVILTWKKDAKDSAVEPWQPSDVEESTDQGSTGTDVLATGKKINPYVINAKKVVFTYEKAPTGVDVWDVSADNISDDVKHPTPATSESKVVLWHDPEDSYTIYISTQDTGKEVKFNRLSSDMFYKCSNLASVIFFNVDTSYIISADRMFSLCISLTQLDLSNWDTTRLNSTVRMFAGDEGLAKIYVGNSKITPPKDDVSVLGIYVTPKLSKYKYYDPNEEEKVDENTDPDVKETIEATKAANKLTIDSFNYTLRYDNGNAAELVVDKDNASEEDKFTINPNDIESFSPEYPNFGDQSNRSGELEVTIKLKESSPYYKYTTNGELKVTINVVDPGDEDDKFEVDEHPSATVEAKDESWGMYLSVLKADESEISTQADGDDNSAEDSVTGIGKAQFTVYAATDLKNYAGDTIVKEGTAIKTITSIAKDEDDGGRSGTDLLPFDYYAVDKNAKNLYKIVETKAPDGYAINSTPAYVPNINYRELSVEDALAKIRESLGDKITAKYSKEDRAFSIAFTFYDKKTPTITKDWGSTDKDTVPEDKKPDHLTIWMFRDPNRTQLYKTITLKAPDWSYSFDEDIDLSKFYYAEDTSNFPENVKVDTSIYSDGYKINKENNSVKFYNYWDRQDPKVVPSVHKVWKDNNNVNGKRPREILVTLYQNDTPVKKDIKLNESNNWTFTGDKNKDALPQFDEFGQEYTYKWVEDNDSLGEDYELVSDSTTVTEDDSFIYMTTELVNAYSLYTSSSVTKTWNDEENLYGQRPGEIKVHLLADGKQVKKFTVQTTDANGITTNESITNGIVTLTQRNNWTAKALDLDKYNGDNRIQYTWEEEDVGDGYEQASNATTIENEDETNETFITKITNKYTPDYGSVKVSKVIPVSSLDFRHGDITFKFDLTGETIHGTEAKGSKSVTFSQDTISDKKNVVTIDGKQYLKLSVTFDNLDWGRYKVTESGSESRYQFDSIDGLKNATVGKDSKGNSYISFTVNKDQQEFTGTFHNRTIPASVKIVKYGKSGLRKLKGVTFQIEKVTENSWEFIKSAKTNDDGEVLFDDLAPGDYEITETNTLKGYTLLKEPIKVTLPLALTPEEAEEMKADTSKAVYDSEKKLYYFYTVSYKVDNDYSFDLPHTGFKDNLKTYLPLIAGMIVIVGVEVWICIGKKRPKKGLKKPKKKTEK